MSVNKVKTLKTQIGKTAEKSNGNGQTQAAVTEAQKRLARHMAVLETQGFDSLDALGKMEIGVGQRSNKKPILISSGIVLPENNPIVGQSVSVDLSVANFVHQKDTAVEADLLKTVSFRSQRSAQRPSIPLNVSYWFANEIVIGDDTDLIISSGVTSIFIITKKITFGKNVSITWERPSFSNISTPPKPETPAGYPTASSVWSYPGRPGKVGKNGNPGSSGQSAPELVEFWFLDKNGSFPAIDLRGQDGQTGGKGGAGGDGGAGQKGCPTEKRLGACSQEQGPGGDGGNGGNGGNGGAGGNGGNGGAIAVFTTSQNILSINQTGLTVDLNEGRGGQGGDPGQGGNGGPGGAKGDKLHTVCQKNSRTAGNRGYVGKAGNSGSNGQAGSKLPNHLSFNAITSNEFNMVITKPAIISTNKQSSYAHIGETVSVTGVRFIPGDQVFMEDYDGNMTIPCNTAFVADNLLTFEVPVTIGGLLGFHVRQLDGTVSVNRGTVLIAPRIKEILLGTRIRPGTDIYIKGTGFDRTGRVEINGEDSGPFTWVDYETIKCRVVRPYGIVRNAAGEKAVLKVINNEGIGVHNYNHSNPIDVTLDTYRICIFGDSVAWNGGNAEHNKYYSLVKDHIESRFNIGVYLTVEAHHGAVIGRGKYNKYDQLHGELSTDYPTIHQQVEKVAGQADAPDVDLVIMDGGANDLPITKVILESDYNQLNQIAATFKQDIERYSYHDFKDLLIKTLNSFPNAEVLPFSYYHIFSGQSDASKITLFTITAYAAFKGLSEEDLKDFFLGTFQINNMNVYSNVTKVVTLNDIWVAESTKWMKKAAEEANVQVEGRNRAHFVDLETEPQHAAHAPQSLLWAPVKENLLLKATDERISEREQLIEDLAQEVRNGTRSQADLDSRDYSPFLTKRNSSYHPNPAGARWMFDKMKPVIDRLKTPKKVVLKAADKYLAVNEHTQKLQLVSGGIDESTVLEMIDLDNDKVALKSVYGKFVCAEQDGGSDVNVNRPKPRPWEMLELVPRGNNRYSLKTGNGHYFKVGANGIINASAGALADAEEFQLI